MKVAQHLRIVRLLSKSILILIPFFFIGEMGVYAQDVELTHEQKLNGWWKTWKNESLDDTARLKAMGSIAKEGYLYSMPDSAFYFAQLEYEFAEKKGLTRYMALSRSTQGGSFALRGEYAKALEYYKLALQLFDELGDAIGQAGTTGNIGIVYQNVDNYPKALDYFLRSLKAAKRLNNQSIMANSYSNIGVIYSNLKDFEKAIDYYQSAYALYDSINDEGGKSNVENNLGLIYKEKGDYDKALEYFRKSLKSKEKLGDKTGIANAKGNMGGVFEIQGEFEQALEMYQQCLILDKEVQDKNGIASDYVSMGILFNKMKLHSKAIVVCSQGLDLAEEMGALLLQKLACTCLFEAYKGKGNSVKALEYHEKMSHLNDSLNQETTTKKLEQMEYGRQMAQDSMQQAAKDLSIKHAHEAEVQRKNRTRDMLIASVIFMLVISYGLYGRWKYVKKSRDVISNERDRSDQLLLNILPEEIANELKETGKAEARHFESVSVLFTDFKEFTQTSSALSPTELVAELQTCFEAFDQICERHKIEKIKTIGDAYMAAGGLPVPSAESIKNTILAALEMQNFIVDRHNSQLEKGNPAFEMRVGIHTGPVVAGIVGVKKFQYDIWGDTVNTASRMESAGEVGKVNISQSTYDLIKDSDSLPTGGGFEFESRGKIEAKGKGAVEMYFVQRTLTP